MRERPRNPCVPIRPRVFLITPSYQNPLGFTVPDNQRQQQAEVLARYGVAAIEDDVYAELHYGPVQQRPLKVFDATGDVLPCCSFSQTIAPAYRVGWIAAGRHCDRARKLKAAFSFHGYLLWVELPRGTDAVALHDLAHSRQIGIVPGRLFSPSGAYGHIVRLSCGHPLRGPRRRQCAR